MGMIGTAVLLVVAFLLVWSAVEIACKIFMQPGRSTLSRLLDPDYDPDNETSSAPDAPYAKAPHPVKERAVHESPKKPSKVTHGEDCG